jgi:hypothetical protein
MDNFIPTKAIKRKKASKDDKCDYYLTYGGLIVAEITKVYDHWVLEMEGLKAKHTAIQDCKIVVAEKLYLKSIDFARK